MADKNASLMVNGYRVPTAGCAPARLPLEAVTSQLKSGHHVDVTAVFDLDDVGLPMAPPWCVERLMELHTGVEEVAQDLHVELHLKIAGGDAASDDGLTRVVHDHPGIQGMKRALAWLEYVRVSRLKAESKHAAIEERPYTGYRHAASRKQAVNVGDDVPISVHRTHVVGVRRDRAGLFHERQDSIRSNVTCEIGRHFVADE